MKYSEYEHFLKELARTEQRERPPRLSAGEAISVTLVGLAWLFIILAHLQ